MHTNINSVHVHAGTRNVRAFFLILMTIVQIQPPYKIGCISVRTLVILTYYLLVSWRCTVLAIYKALDGQNTINCLLHKLSASKHSRCTYKLARYMYNVPTYIKDVSLFYTHCQGRSKHWELIPINKHERTTFVYMY